MTESKMCENLPTFPAYCAIQHRGLGFRINTYSLPMRLAELIVHLKNEKSCLKFQRVACHQPACALCACEPFMRVR